MLAILGLVSSSQFAGATETLVSEAIDQAAMADEVVQERLEEFESSSPEERLELYYKLLELYYKSQKSSDTQPCEVCMIPKPQKSSFDTQPCVGCVVP